MIDSSMYIIEALEGSCNDSEAVRLLETALYVTSLMASEGRHRANSQGHREHLSTASNVMPCVPFIMWAIGRVETEIARRRPFSTWCPTSSDILTPNHFSADDETELLLKKAITNHRRSLLLELAAGPVNSLATTLELYATRLAELQRAKSKAALYSSAHHEARTEPSRRLGQSAAALLTRSNSATTSSALRDSSKPQTSSMTPYTSSSSISTSPAPPKALTPTRSGTAMFHPRSVFPSLTSLAATVLFSTCSRSFLVTLGRSSPAMVRIRRLRAVAARLRELAKRLLKDVHAGSENKSIARLLGS